MKKIYNSPVLEECVININDVLNYSVGSFTKDDELWGSTSELY